MQNFVITTLSMLQGVAAPLTLVLMIDVLTTTMYLGISAFEGKVLAALLFLAIAIIIMILWTFCAVCYDLCKAKMFKTKCKRVLVNIVIGVGGSLYLIGDNLPPMLELLQSEQQASNTTCGQLPNNPTSGVALDFLLYGFSLTTYGKVLIGMSVFLFSMFPSCVFKFNTHEEIHETIIEKEENFPVTFTLTSLAVIVEINAWFAIIVANPTPVCHHGEMIADFVIYGLFVIGWFVIITIFLISDCRKADERKRKRSVKLYVIFAMFVLIPSLPIYLIADNSHPLSCVPHLISVTDRDLVCVAVNCTRFVMLLVLSVFLTLLTAFTACCQIYLMCVQKKYENTQKK